MAQVPNNSLAQVESEATCGALVQTDSFRMQKNTSSVWKVKKDPGFYHNLYYILLEMK